jgi:hypothetical protein
MRAKKPPTRAVSSCIIPILLKKTCGNPTSFTNTKAKIYNSKALQTEATITDNTPLFIYLLSNTYTLLPTNIIGTKKIKKYVAPPNKIFEEYATKEGSNIEGSVLLKPNLFAERNRTKFTILPTSN